MASSDPGDLQGLTSQIKQALSERTGKPADAIQWDHDLLLDLELDSLAIAELLAVLEQSVGHQVPVDQLLDVSTVGDLIRLLARHSPEKPSRSEGDPGSQPHRQ